MNIDVSQFTSRDTNLFALVDFRGVVLVTVAIFAIYFYAILIFRLFLRAFPLRVGEIAEGSQQEFVYHVYVLFFLMRAPSKPDHGDGC